MTKTVQLLAGIMCLCLPLLCQAQAAEPTLEERVRALEDIEAIRALLVDYGRYLDARRWDDFSRLFAEDGGTWNGGMGIATGREEIRRMMIDSIGDDNRNAAGTGMSNLHLLGNEIIELDGDSATAVSKWVFVMTAADGGPEDVFVGRYEDRLVRVQGVWKFKERVVLGDIMQATTVDELGATNTGPGSE